jgi:HAD superfamily hydrolase (TIGR01459 family)
MMPQHIAGFAQIVDRFAGLIVDQFGVLHDGTRVYPCVEQCLRQLEDAGKRMVVLSNSGRRAADNCRRLAALGLPTAQFEAVITSGEVAWTALATRTDAFHRALGRRCLLLAEDGDQSFLDGLDLDAVGTAADADFVLVVGIDTPQRSLADYDPELALAARRNLPLLCANSDLVRLTPLGLQPAPGALARRYAELGGPVHGYGKPLRPIFDQGLAALDGIARDCVLVVGDSLDHDILGAERAGIGSIYVRGGVGADIDDATMDAAMRALDARPCYVVQEFRW